MKEWLLRLLRRVRDVFRGPIGYTGAMGPMGPPGVCCCEGRKAEQTGRKKVGPPCNPR